GYNDAVEAEGGLTIDAATEFDYFHYGDFLADGTVDLPMLCASRPLFEYIARERLAAYEGVHLRGETVFREFLSESGGIDPSGVRVTTRGGTDERLDADLVVDATGRTSRTPDWLDRAGYTRPSTDSVKIDLAYSTVAVDRPADRRQGYLVAPDTELRRGGTAVPVEDDRWLVTLFGLHGDHPPTDPDGLQSFAASLPTPVLYRLLDNHEWRMSEANYHPFQCNQWRHYAHLDRWPSGLLPIGDTIASFNPIYGQGMSVAALEALELHAAMREQSQSSLPTLYLDRAEDVLSNVWLMTVSADHQFPQTTGPKPRGTDLFNWYQSRLIRGAHADGRLSD
ncbi:MAG: NAD(P)/FAD-dependent oxidoreductase, partial [Salinirussus sp.]